jgi:hypothetical protein
MVARLDWNKARRNQRSWAYTASQPPDKRGRKGQHIADLHHELSVLTHRINRGQEMLDALPLGDPKYSAWRNHLFGLIRERSRLRRL